MSAGQGHIRQRGKSSWEIRYRAGGNVVTTTVRGTKREAQAALRTALNAVDAGTHVKPQKKLTVGAHVQARIEHWHASGRIGTRTRENYDTFAAEIADTLGSIALQRLSSLDVENWHGVMRGKGLTRTASAAHAVLARALDDAIKHQLAARNAAREQGPPPGERKRPAILTPEQIADLIAKVEKNPWRVPVVVALYTGIRRGEQLALRWNRVDLDARAMQVVEALDETEADGVAVKLPKSAAGVRTICLPQVVVDALRKHRNAQRELSMSLGRRPPEDALVFPGPDGRHDSPRAFSTRWGRAAARLGIPEITWHAWRHMHASQLIRAGVDIVTISRRLGHSKPDVTLRTYAHMFAKDDSAAAAAIDKALGG